MGDGGGEGEDEVQFLRTVRFCLGPEVLGDFLLTFLRVSLSLPCLLVVSEIRGHFVFPFFLITFSTTEN